MYLTYAHCQCMEDLWVLYWQKAITHTCTVLFLCLPCVYIGLGPICVVSAEQICQVISKAECYLYLSWSFPSHSFIPIVFDLSIWPHLSAFLFTDPTCSSFPCFKIAPRPPFFRCAHTSSVPPTIHSSLFQRHLLCEQMMKQRNSLKTSAATVQLPARPEPYAYGKHLLTQWFLRWPCAQLVVGSWLRWSSACHVCPPGIPRCQRSRSPPAGKQYGGRAPFKLRMNIVPEMWSCGNHHLC